jgi:hypothetical protein
MSNFAADYVDVAERIRMFRDLYPEGSLRPANPDNPFWIEDVPNVGPRLVYVAAAYRHPEDPAPGIGSAWEPLPGKTPYTKDSELMVAETSAWGRAIVAALAADTKRGVASADEVRARRHPERKTDPLEWTMDLHDRAVDAIGKAGTASAVDSVVTHARTRYNLHADDLTVLQDLARRRVAQLETEAQS